MSNEEEDGSAAATEADALRDTGDIDGAIALLAAAAAKDGSHPGLWHNLGALYYESGDLKAAVEAFGHAIEGGYPSSVNRGLVLEALGEVGAARGDYLDALRVDPDDVDALVNLGTLELDEENYLASKSHLLRAAALDSKANWQLADLYRAMGSSSDALAALGQAIDSGELRAHLERAHILAEEGSDRDAILEFELAIAAGARNARRDYAIYLDESGRPEEALAVARIGVGEGDDLCYAPAAVISEELGRFDEAIELYSKAIDAGDTGYQSDLDALLERKLDR